MDNTLLANVRRDGRRAAPNGRPVIKLLVIAGEASSDEHAADVISALRRMYPSIEMFGMGGSALRAMGVETLVDSETSASLMGLSEIPASICKVIGAYRKLVKESARRHPDMALLVDYSGFNLRIARALRRQGTKVLYFISPQLWAWRKGRIKTVRKYVDRLAVIFPFEEDFYLERGVQAKFVGHPFLDRRKIGIGREDYLDSIGLSPELPVLALLPGSRKSEIERLFPPMMDAFRRLRRARPSLQAVIPVARGLDVSWIENVIGEEEGIAVVDGQARQVLRFSDVAVVASGTATVEAALERVPFVVVYKLSRLNWMLARLLIRGLSHISMANLIAEEGVVAEFLQGDVSGERLAVEIETLLGDPLLRKRLSERLSVVAERLQGRDAVGTAASRTAELLLDLAF